jgi:hypothetical protein
MNCERARVVGPRRMRLAIVGRLFIGVLGVFLFVMQASVARGQRLDGGLRVEVGDSTGASIVDAKVTVTNEATNVSVSTNASSAGTYVFPNLLVGTYAVTVEKPGFKKSIQKGVTVESNKVAEAKVALELGEVSAVIEVEAGADLVKTESSTLDVTFSGKAVQDIPINTLGGDVKEYAVLAPGTTTQQGGVLGSGGSIGGTRPRFNGFNIDGVEDNKLDTNGPTQPVIQESVAEFTLLTNQFSADNGHSAGGLFNIVTKSGTNNWHGTGWENNRNRNYDAFDNQQKARGFKDRYDYNRAGASAGGPIRKDRLFVYGAYEFQNNGAAASSPQVNLPTAAGLQTINTLAHDDAVRAILKQIPAAPANNAGTVNVVANGTTTAIPVGTFTSVAPSFTNQHDFIVNSDLTVGKHQVSTRFLYDRFRAPDFNPSLPLAQFLGTNGADGRKAIVSDTWTISSRVINNFHTSYSRSAGPQITSPAGFQNFPNVIIDDLSSVNLGPEQNGPQSYTQNVYQWADTINYVRGPHTFKVGAEAKKYIAPTNGLPRARGEWDYTTLSQLVNDFVPNGAPNKALRGAGSGNVAENYNAVYWFLQDDWKITSRLTINAGLRYEYSGVPRAENDQAINAISDDPALGIFFRAPKPDVNNFAPRLGFAYDPTGRGKWAIRGGAGIAYDVTPNNFAINSLPPQRQTEQKPAVTCALPGAPAWCLTWKSNLVDSGQGFLQGGGLLQVNVPPTTQLAARAKTSSLILDHVSPKIITWTLGVQHELFRNSSIEVRYVGTRSLSLPVQRRLNSASAFDPHVPGGGLTPLPTYFSAADAPKAVANPVITADAFDQFQAKGFFQPYSVDGFFGSLTSFPASGSGIYHSGSVDFMHRFTKGLYFRANYTFSKNIDNATNELFSSIVNPRRAQDGNNFPGERGLSALDIRHKLAISWVYDFPNISTEHGYLKALAHGWELSGSYIAESGQPVTPLSDNDANANGDGAGDRTIINPNGIGLTGTTVTPLCNNGLAGGGATYVDAACDPNHADDKNVGGDPTPGAGDAATVGYVADSSKARFVQAGFGAKANAGRNTVGTPGLNIWNASILKNTKITERFSLQFHADTYNTFNHPNFSIGLPTNNGALDQTTNPNPFSAAYVNVDSGSQFLNSRLFNGGSRSMQLGLKLIW